MRLPSFRTFRQLAPLVVGVTVLLPIAVPVQAQPEAGLRPLRARPRELVVANPGFRDWGPTTVAGNTVLGGNQTGRGGLFAIDASSGKVRWSVIPKLGGSVAISTAPAVAGDVVLAAFAASYPGAVIAVSLATGKELWRATDPAVNAGIAISGALAYTLGKDGRFRALEVATGREAWAVAFATNRAVCAMTPVVRDGVVYVMGIADATPGDPLKPAGYYLFALDAATGAERWRYRAEAPYVHPGACLRQPVVTADAIFATGDNYLYAIARATGRDLWKPIEVRRPVDGRDRAVEVQGLVDAGSVVVGMTSGFLVGFNKSNGSTAWQLPGEYAVNFPSTMVVGDVLYFQGSPAVAKAPSTTGTLHALDLNTRQILWSFSRTSGDTTWSLGPISPIDGGMWVGANLALLKLGE